MAGELQSQLQRRPRGWLGQQNLSQRERATWGGSWREPTSEVASLGSEDREGAGRLEPLRLASHIKGSNVGMLEQQRRG